LNELGYSPIEETIIPGSNHFPVLQFYKDNPGYEHYWNIEYDVYFNGDWNIFFEEFETVNADFISSHIEPFNRRPMWYWWNTLALKTVSVDGINLLKSFNPVYRISNSALNFLDAFLSKGNSGHHEVLIPTILNHHGFSLLDMGGCGDFTADFLLNRYYRSSITMDDYYSISTMRYRPMFTRTEIEKRMEDNKLYHPVKE
jgi:hypothetical protein